MTDIEKTQPSADASDDFEKQAHESTPGLAREFIDFLKHNKKWWLIPIIIVLLAFGLLAIFGAGSPVAPFIYPLF